MVCSESFIPADTARAVYRSRLAVGMRPITPFIIFFNLKTSIILLVEINRNMFYVAMSVSISWLKTAIFEKPVHWLREENSLVYHFQRKFLEICVAVKIVWWSFPVKVQAVLQVFPPSLQAPWRFPSVLCTTGWQTTARRPKLAHCLFL